MKDNFVSKLETDNFYIGSFDAYIEESKELIKRNSRISEDEVNDILKTLPTTYRATILDKEGNYIGFIGLYNIDAKDDVASLRFEVNRSISEEEKIEIVNEFRKYISDSINITKLDEVFFSTNKKVEVEKQEVYPSADIIISNNLLVPGISEELLEKYSEDYAIPRLQMPFTIMSKDKPIGIIGLSSLIWSNKRANLNIFLDKKLGDEIVNELPGEIIDDYINYAHASSVHNISLSVSGSNNNLLDILKNTNMNYYGSIPYGAKTGDNVESNMMFQHVPFMKKDSGIYIPDNRVASISSFETDSKELSKKIELDNGFKMVSPIAFEEENIDFNSVLNSHIKAMQNREGFTIPLGEDKYFLQKGNEKYGITKALMNYTYVVLDENNNYAGYINTLRTNADGKNVEVEIGIDPKLQNRGLGTKVINSFYNELFKTGVASVTSSVFEFNNPSIKLHEKVAELNGIRLNAYYINGRLWDMNIYSKVNDEIKESKFHR